ncbi:MAG: TolC family protein [Gammaproteobacteria bacterium HGW-Gammaproteobacteria-4]|jgi:cobalt-zinc-cadmium efflux system outer membrane protein|nr:MAG: TolC family protein [Gammaproteobacteria bacterium HGW-Gammaproteobacteria-4]
MKVLLARALGACYLVVALLAPPAQAADAAPPLTLGEAVNAALAGNPNLTAFAFELRAQDARTRRAALRPPLQASVEAENILGTGDNHGLNAAEVTFALSGVVELGDKRTHRISAALAQFGVAEVENQARQLDVLAEVTRRFITVAAAQERQRLAQRGSELASQTVAGSQRRVTAAKSPHVELSRARIAQNRAQLEQRRAVTELDAARRQLAAMWGESQPVIDGHPFGEVRGDLFVLPPTGEFGELLGRLKANPDFLRFASETRLRDAELRLAATLRKPDLTLSAGVRRLEQSGDNAFVASLSIPLFSGSRARSFVAEAQANLERVDAERRAAEVKASATLYELLQQLRQAVLEARTLKDDMQPRAEEALKETRYAYERGRYGYLELVDAQREFLAVKQALIAAASDAHILRAEIERLTNAPLATP